MTGLENYRAEFPEAIMVESIGNGKWQLWGIPVGEWFEGEWFNTETGEYQDPYSLSINEINY